MLELKKDIITVFREPVNTFPRLKEMFIKSMDLNKLQLWNLERKREVD